MRKIMMSVVAGLLLTVTVNAQSVYSTKTGRINFFSDAPLEDIEAKNNEVESKLAPANGQVYFVLLIKGFRFKNQLMEDHFNENYMESSKYPKSEFRGYVTNMKDVNLAKDGVYPVKVKGNLTIHNVTNEINTDGTIEVKNGKPIAKTKFNVKLKDYKIGGSMIGTKIAETIEVNVNCKYD